MNTPQNGVRTIVLALSFSLFANGSIANAAIVTDINTGKQMATTFGMQTNVGIFGDMKGVVPNITDEQRAINDLAHFFGPDAKEVLVRFYSEYAALKAVALKHKVTSPERLASTDVISVSDKAAMLGFGDIDNYALRRGLVTSDEFRSGGLAYETKVLTVVNADIDARLASGELKQLSRPIAGIVPVLTTEKA